MALQSKTKLFAALDRFFGTTEFTEKKLDAVGNETYGRKSFIYVGGRGQRPALEAFLRSEGFGLNSNYAPGTQTVEVQVSYFKGWHHDE